MVLHLLSGGKHGPAREHTSDQFCLQLMLWERHNLERKAKEGKTGGEGGREHVEEQGPNPLIQDVNKAVAESRWRCVPKERERVPKACAEDDGIDRS